MNKKNLKLLGLAVSFPSSVLVFSISMIKLHELGFISFEWTAISIVSFIMLLLILLIRRMD